MSSMSPVTAVLGRIRSVTRRPAAAAPHLTLVASVPAASSMSPLMSPAMGPVMGPVMGPDHWHAGDPRGPMASVLHPADLSGVPVPRRPVDSGADLHLLDAPARVTASVDLRALDDGPLPAAAPRAAAAMAMAPPAPRMAPATVPSPAPPPEAADVPAAVRTPWSGMPSAVLSILAGPVPPGPSSWFG